MSQSKERVLAVYPDANLTEFPDGAHAIASRMARQSLGFEYIGWGQTTCRKDCAKATAEAWDDAASKLPHPEPPIGQASIIASPLNHNMPEPPSPAGEIASEHGECNCAPVDGKHSIYCPEWVPEPVPAEGAPLGTCTDFPTTPHPEGTCESCVMWKPIAQPSAPEAAASPGTKMTIDDCTSDEILQGEECAAAIDDDELRAVLAQTEAILLHCERRLSAAPIAPADESTATSERLLRAINWAMGCGPDDFRSVRHDAPRFWWRSELAERAGLEYDGEKYVIRPTPPVREQP